MISFAKKIALVALTAATAFAPIAAQAGDWRWRGDNQRYLNYREYSDRQNQWRGSPRHVYRQHNRHYRNYRNNDAIALGVLGLAAGAVIGGAIANSPRYVEPQPIYRHRPARVIQYQGGLEPWTRGWYNYCQQRYRSFNARTGTFRGYDGRDHFCVAN